MEHIYAVYFQNEITKVGRTSDWKNRLRHYITPAHFPIVDSWVSPLTPYPNEVERTLINLCRVWGNQIGQYEYFESLPLNKAKLSYEIAVKQIIPSIFEATKEHCLALQMHHRGELSDRALENENRRFHELKIFLDQSRTLNT